MYPNLTEEMKKEIEGMTGTEVYVKSLRAFKPKKISDETMMQINAYWLNFYHIRGPWNKYETAKITVSDVQQVFELEGEGR